jgi:S-adenosylmethionine/arginine decarboxylase-like enzyme
MDSWGKHLIIDARGCLVNRATDPNYIKFFTKELVRMIEMVPYGEPQLVHFAENTDKAGWTVIQLIETSNIIGHFLDINGDLYLDVFSCKDYDVDIVLNLLQQCFSPEEIKFHVVKRDARSNSETQ